MKLAEETWCINLYERNDRYQNSQNELHKMKQDHCKFFRTHKHPKSGVIGCFESHMSLLSRLNYIDTICIFEDDIKMTEEWNDKNILRCIQFMNENNDWLIFFLGCNPHIFYDSPHKTNYDNIYKLQATTAHSYIVSKRILPYIRGKEKYTGIPIDVIYKNLPNTYGYIPGLVQQGSFLSDIGTVSTSNPVFRNLRYNTLNNINNYVYYINMPILLLIYLILYIICLVYLFKHKS